MDRETIYSSFSYIFAISDLKKIPDIQYQKEIEKNLFWNWIWTVRMSVQARMCQV